MEAGGAARRPEDQAGPTTIRWKPNEECLQLLLGMGIDRNTAVKGLYYTGNHSAEFAAAYVFDNPDMDDELDASLRVETRDVVEDHVGDGVRLKMVFVVNSALGMSVGKTAGQVAHASLGLYRKLVDDQRFSNELLLWLEEGEKKVVLRGDDLPHIREMEKQATSFDVPTYLVHDAGRTEVPADSTTVLALFGREDQVNAVTGHLSLL